MKSKLCSKRGETLVEGMVSLVVIVMVIAMLPMAVETAAKINASVKQMETICSHTMSEETKLLDGNNVRAGLWIGDTQIDDWSVQGYTEDGFTYYVGNNG